MNKAKKFKLMKSALIICGAMLSSASLQAQVFGGDNNVNSDTSDISVNSDTSINSDISVSSDTGVNSDISVNSDTNVNSDNSVNSSSIVQRATVKPPVEILYTPVPQVVPEQSQLIYYYPASVNAGPLSVYIDKEFHTALLPGQFTTLCVKEGQHALTAAVNDAPLYTQKTSEGVSAQFKGGKTYFVRSASRDGSVVSESVYRKEAESELQGLKRNTLIINRAAVVENCRYVGGGKDVTLISDRVMFKFAGSSYAQLVPESQHKLKSLIEFAKNSNSVSNITLVGFTDGIGKPESNNRLSEARAESVRRAMIDAGIDGAIISASGSGIAHTSQGCSTRHEDGCNKMSRRVDIAINSN